MANLNGFNAHEIDPIANFQPIPAGKYQAAITDSEMKATKSGNGSYLQLAFTIIEGEHKGRIVWARLNLNNPHPTAVKMARAELSAICHAVGIMQPRDSVELHNIPLEITVTLKKREGSSELSNEIKGYERKGSAGQAPQAPVTDNTPPWRRT